MQLNQDVMIEARNRVSEKFSPGQVKFEAGANCFEGSDLGRHPYAPDTRVHLRQDGDCLRARFHTPQTGEHTLFKAYVKDGEHQTMKSLAGFCMEFFASKGTPVITPPKLSDTSVSDDDDTDDVEDEEDDDNNDSIW